MRREFVKAQPQAAESVLKGIRRAKRWMMNNPEVAEAIIAQEMDMDLDIIELAWEKHDWAARLSDEFEADIEEKKQFLASEWLIQKDREDRTKGLVDKALGGNEPLP